MPHMQHSNNTLLLEVAVKLFCPKSAFPSNFSNYLGRMIPQSVTPGIECVAPRNECTLWSPVAWLTYWWGYKNLFPVLLGGVSTERQHRLLPKLGICLPTSLPGLSATSDVWPVLTLLLKNAICWMKLDIYIWLIYLLWQWGAGQIHTPEVCVMFL